MKVSRKHDFHYSEIASHLHDLIITRNATFGIVGLGYVGLPLAVAFAEAGMSVIGYDVNAKTVERLQQGDSHIQDVSSDSLDSMVKAGKFVVTTDMGRLSEPDVICICVPTPLNKTRDPDISYVTSAADQVARTLRAGQLIILESTTYPGTTRDVLLSRFEPTGLVAGKDYFLAFSPERVDPGNANYGMRNTPKVVGGLDQVSTALATEFYGQVVENVHTVSSPEAAEMVKLLENMFRSVNIALVNETALMCDRLGIDIWEVIEAASTKPFGFMPFYPGPGIGGHCIPLDPFYLSWKMKTLNYRARFVELASEINSAMPEHVVEKVSDALNEVQKSVNGAKILILGVAYKPDINDVRESPALDVIGLLRAKGAIVNYHDPHVPEISMPGASISSSELTPEVLGEADCVVIVTNHSAVDLEVVISQASLIVDTRNAMAKVNRRQQIGRVIKI